MAGPRHHWIKRLVHDFEYNPRFQFRFHVVAILFWWANLVAGTAVLFFWPRLWLDIGVYYVFVLSLYANADTDYDAMSAALAAMRGGDILAKMGTPVASTQAEAVIVVAEKPGTEK